MPIKFRCNICRRKLKVSRARAGQKIFCPSCGKTIVVPRATESELDAAVVGTGAARPPQAFSWQRGGNEEEEVDMTPMIDMTFLLLVFFMVTAAFALQKSMEIPPEQQVEGGASPVQQERQEDADFLVVRVDRRNVYWVEEEEAPSVQDLLVKLRHLRDAGSQGSSPRLLVLANREATHARVVAALDAGMEIGMEEIRLATEEEIY